MCELRIDVLCLFFYQGVLKKKNDLSAHFGRKNSTFCLLYVAKCSIFAVLYYSLTSCFKKYLTVLSSPLFIFIILPPKKRFIYLVAWVHVRVRAQVGEGQRG